MTSNTKPKMNTEAKIPPLLIEAISEATYQGKTTIIQSVRDYLDDHGIPNVVVRVESSRLTAALRDGDVTIATEDLAQVETTSGGIVGIVKPGLQELARIAKDGGVVLWDWPGSFGQQRQEILVRASLDGFLSKQGITAITFAMTTNVPHRIAEAQRLLEMTRKIAPSFRRILVLNELVGNFRFAEASESSRILSAAKAAATEALPLSKISDVSLATLKPSGLSIREIIAQDPEELADLIGEDVFTTNACLTAVAAWYSKLGGELRRILPFRPSSESLSAPVEAPRGKAQAA